MQNICKIKAIEKHEGCSVSSVRNRLRFQRFFIYSDCFQPIYHHVGHFRMRFDKNATPPQQPAMQYSKSAT